MAVSKPSITSFHLIVRWAARVSSILVIVVFLLMFLGEGFDPAKVKPLEWIMLLFGPFGFILGMVLGWWKEGLGGAITLVCFFAAMFVGDYSASGARYLVVCTAPGFLFLFSWILSNPAMFSGNKPDPEKNPSQPPADEKS